MLNPSDARRQPDNRDAPGLEMVARYTIRDAGSATSAAIAVLLLLALLFTVAIAGLQPPAALPASAPADQFSAYRAIDKLRVIASEPHPVGSPANARVREYLTGELSVLGLDPHVQTASVARSEPKWSNRIVGATINNIVARLPGTANTRPLMLAAHYDSVPGGPGASDDGSGVVAILETARAIRAGPALRNDVIILFTDAEEEGLLGAQAFVNEHPWAHEPGAVLNVEARGACGPSVMFETSSGNGWLVREFAKASPDPVASSFSYEAYKRLPNDTDLTIFKRAGLAGLNFAYVGCFARYHTREDSVGNLDPRSIQHDGSYTLALTRRLGNLDLARTSAPDAVFFNVWHLVIGYPLSWTGPIFGLLVVLFIVTLIAGFRRGRLRVGGILAGFAGWFVAAGGSVLVVQAIWSVLGNSRFVSRLPYGMAYNGDYYAWAFVALTVALVTAVYAGLLRWFNVESLAIGTLGWWFGLSGLTVFAAPGASYLFLWPLIACCAELTYAFTRRDPEREASSVLLWTLPAAVVILLLGAMPDQLIMLLGTVLLPPLILMTALLAGFLAPYVHILTRPGRWWLSGVAALLAAGLIVVGMTASGFDANHPRADSIFYTLDADKGIATWCSIDAGPDDWTGRFLKGPLEKGNLTEVGIGPRSIVKAAAPVQSLAGPTLTTFEDSTQGSVRQLGFELHFAPGTSLTWVSMKNAHVRRTVVNGRPVTVAGAEAPGPPAGTPGPGGSSQPWVLLYSAPPSDGLRVEVKMDSGGSPVLQVAQDSSGLPSFAGATFNPRPAKIMSTQWWPPLDSSTVVTRTFDRFDSTMKR